MKTKVLIAIKSYATEENIVFLQNDVVVTKEVLGTEKGTVNLLGIKGWCEGSEMVFSHKVIVEYFASAKN